MALLWQKAKKGTDVKAEKPEKKVVAKKASVKAVKKIEEKAEKAKTTAEKRVAAVQGVVFPKGSAVVKPRITEKSGILSQKGIYTFDVRVDANVREIAKAIVEAYKVTPVKVSTASIKSKAMFVRGKSGKTVSGKKAYVYLKKGDTIEFI